MKAPKTKKPRVNIKKLEMSKKNLAKEIVRKTSILELVPGIVYVASADSEAKTLWMSDDVFEVTGFPSKSFLQNPKFWMSRIHPDDRVRVANDFSNKLFSEGSVTTEYRWHHKNGGYCWFMDKATLIRNSRGQPHEIIGIWFDITSKKVSELKLEISNRRNTHILESITDAFFALDRQWNFVYLNKQALPYFRKKSSSDLLGKNIWEEVPSLLNSNLYKQFHLSVRKKQVIHYEDVWPADQNLWLEYRIYHSLDGISVYFTDKTKLKEDEEKLKESEHNFHELAEAMPQIVWTKNANDETTFYNRQWSLYTGYSIQNNPGSKDWMHPDDYDKYLRVWNKSKNTGRPFDMEYRLKHKSGQYRWFLGRAIAVKNRKGQIIKWFGTATDIHDRKIAEELLQNQALRFRKLIENSSDIKALIDSSGVIRYMSSSVKRVLNCSSKKFIGKNVTSFVHKEDWPVIMAAIDPEKNSSIIKVEYRVKNSEGKWRWLEGTINNLLKDPLIGAFLVNSRDITDRKELERRKDEFISMASHELKTPVTTVKLYAEILRNEFREKKNLEHLGYVDNMISQIDSLTRLINELLDISKIQAGKLEMHKEIFILEELIKETVDRVKLLNKTHEIEFQSNERTTVFGDRHKIGQVIINLLTNAIRYSPDNPKIEVKTLSKDNTVTVFVKDHGIGIRKDEQNKIFDRFYQIRDRQEKPFAGLGIGLYISSEIIKKHRGTISVDSTYKKGSTFYFTLPIERKKAQRAFLQSRSRVNQ